MHCDKFIVCRRMLKNIFIIVSILFFKLSYGQNHNCIISDNDFEGIKSAILNITSEEGRANTGVEIIKKTNCCFYSKHIYGIAQSLTDASYLNTFLRGVYDNILDYQSSDFNKLLSLYKADYDKNSFSTFVASNISACSNYENGHQKKAGFKKKNIDQSEKIDNKKHNDSFNKTDAINKLNMSGSSAVDSKKFIEWIEPVKNIKTVHGYNRVKAKIYCNTPPEIALMVDNIIIQTQPDQIIPIEDKGYIYSYYVGLHEGDNIILIRFRNPIDSSFIYSKELIINYQPE